MLNVTNLTNQHAHEYGRLLAAQQAQADGAPEVALMILAGTVYVATRRTDPGAWQLGGWGLKHTTGTAAVVFADLSGREPRFTVVPSGWLRGFIDNRRAAEYPDGVRPVTPDSEHVGIWPRDIAAWGAWRQARPADWRGGYTNPGPAGCVGLAPAPAVLAEP